MTMPTQAEFDCALWLNGEAAIEVAEAAAGATGWPPLMTIVDWRESSVLEARPAEPQLARESSCPLGYWYPVPRARVEQVLTEARRVEGPGGVWREHLESALRGDAEAVRLVAIEIARSDRGTAVQATEVPKLGPAKYWHPPLPGRLDPSDVWGQLDTGEEWLRGSNTDQAASQPPAGHDELSRRAFAAVGWTPGMRTMPEVSTGRAFRAVADVGAREPLRFVQEAGPHGFGWGLHIDHGRGCAAVFGRQQVDMLEVNEVALLDLDDATTLGCLEGRMLAAWPGARITIDLDPWTLPACVEVRVCPAPGEPCHSFFGRGVHARAEALVAALEAAPRREGSTS